MPVFFAKATAVRGRQTEFGVRAHRFSTGQWADPLKQQKLSALLTAPLQQRQSAISIHFPNLQFFFLSGSRL